MMVRFCLALIGMAAVFDSRRRRKKRTYLDLNDPDGWRFSSLRKTLLLRFRNSLTHDKRQILVTEKEEEGGGGEHECEGEV